MTYTQEQQDTILKLAVLHHTSSDRIERLLDQYFADGDASFEQAATDISDFLHDQYQEMLYEAKDVADEMRLDDDDE